MRDIGQRISKRPFLSTMIYAALWLVLFSILSWPLGIYTGYFREHAYGLATQTFGEWSLDELKELLLSLVFIPPIIALLYAAVRKAEEVSAEKMGRLMPAGMPGMPPGMKFPF